MKNLFTFVLLTAAAVLFTACGAPATNTPANANAGNTGSNVNANANAKPVTAAPTKESLLALENKAFEAWKAKDGKFFEGFLADNFMMYGRTGRIGKAEAVKMILEDKCDVKSFAITDGQVTPAGADVAVYTFKATADAICEGKKQPNVWAATIYVRSGDTWKAVYHNESPIAPPPPAAAKAEKKETPIEAADDLTKALLATEQKAWDAWKQKDAKLLEGVLSKDFVAIETEGRADKAATIKSWTDHNCDIKSYGLSQGKSVSINPTTALLTFRGDAEGTCGDFKLRPLWGTTLFVKEGEEWHSVFYMSNLGG